MSTADINLRTHELRVWAAFMKKLEDAGVPPAVAAQGILHHEVGHYVTFPHDLATGLYLGMIAHQQFKQHGKEIYLFYADAVDNIDCLRSNIRRGPVEQVWRAMGRITDSPLDRAILGLYQEQLGIDFGITPTGEEKKAVKNLTSINYMASWQQAEKHAANLISFGEALVPLFAARKKHAPSPANLDDIVKRAPEYIDALANAWPETLQTYLFPLLTQPPKLILPGGHEENGGDGCTDLDEYTNDDVNDALDDIIRRHGKIPYEMVKEFAKRMKPGFQDRFGEDMQKSQDKFAGVEGIEGITWHDDQVPYYNRWAGTYGLFITKKPLKEDAHDLYPHEQVPYEVGDEFNKVNPWSSPLILPGITQRWKEKQGRKTELKLKTPDLFVMLDTSGSMPAPNYQSHAVLAAFILGRNYHANGSRVGIGNFSADILLVPPTRDLDTYQRAACAYWGGGTVLDVDRIKDWFRRLQRAGDARVKDIEVSTEEDYDMLISRLSPRERKEFEEKRLDVRVEKLPELYERIDNILISDGAIHNIEDVVGYLNGIARKARNTIFLINSPSEYRAWKQLQLENTTIYHVETPEDLTGLAIGRARTLPAGLYLPEGRGRK